MMKCIYLVLLLFLSGNLRAQAVKGGAFTLTGILQHAQGLKVYLKSSEDNNKTFSDSTTTDEAGKFSFRGGVEYPAVFSLRVKGKKSRIDFFAENVAIVISGDADSLDKANVKSGKEQEKYKGFEASRNRIYDVGNALQIQFMKSDSGDREVTQRAAVKAYEKTMNDVKELIRDLVVKDPSSAASIRMIESIAKVTTARIADSLAKLVERSPAGSYRSARLLRKKIDRVLTVSIGAQAPDFLQPDSSGLSVSLSSFKGRYVLVDFWASWCAPCRAENVNVLKAYNMYKDKNFAICSISIDTKRDAWVKAIKEDHLPWIQLSDLKGPNTVAETYSVWAIPTNYLIDPSGKIIGISLRGDDLDNTLKELFD